MDTQTFQWFLTLLCKDLLTEKKKKKKKHSLEVENRELYFIGRLAEDLSPASSLSDSSEGETAPKR